MAITVLGQYSVLKLLVMFLLCGGDFWSPARQRKRLIKFHRWDTLWYSLFDWPESGFVRAKKYLTGQMIGYLLSVIFSPRALTMIISTMIIFLMSPGGETCGGITKHWLLSHANKSVTWIYFSILHQPFSAWSLLSFSLVEMMVYLQCSPEHLEEGSITLS